MISRFCFTILFFALSLSAQLLSERGAIPVVNYVSNGDYRSDRDLWSTVRTPSGLMYFGNSEGLLQYNGTSWNLFHLPKRTSIQSLAVDRLGRIMVGSDNEIGFFQETENGLHYTSLTHFIPEMFRTFSQIWTCDTLNGLTYFQSSSAIFVLRDDTIYTLPAKELFGLTYRYDGRLLVQDKGAGLVELNGVTITPFDSSSFFKTRSIAYIFPASKNKHFIVTKYDGIFLYDGATPTQFSSTLNNILKLHRPYRGTVLSNGENAIGTIGGGVIIFDSLGSIQSIINKQTGLKNSTVTSVTDDGYGNIWLTCYEGISRFMYPAPLTIFSDKQGIGGVIKTAIRHRGKLYAGTVEKFYSMHADTTATSIMLSGSPYIFTEIEGVKEDCAFSLTVGSDLLVSTTQGVFVINAKGKKLVTRMYALPLLQSKTDTNRIFIGTFGLASMYRKNGVWMDEGLYKDITEDIYQIIEDRPGVLWLRTYNQGIIRVKVENGPSRNTKIERYGTEQGLPSLSYFPVAVLNGRALFPSESGILSFNEQTGMFEIDSLFQYQFPHAPEGIFKMSTNPAGEVWFFIDQPDGYRLSLWQKNEEGTFEQRSIPFALPLTTRVQQMLFDDDGVRWFSTTTGLYRYDPNVSAVIDSSFVTRIEKITLTRNDSLIMIHHVPGGLHQIELQFKNNSIQFWYSSNTFVDETQTMYSHFLEGFESGWSVWSREDHKEYTNLDPGTYQFRVRSKNAFGLIGNEASVLITILPPWWRTWWFLLIVGLFFLTVGPVIYYLRVSALKKENEQQEYYSRQIINRQEQERKRIAHELHDSISQSLLSIKNRASMAIEKPNEHQWVMEQLDVILSSSTGAIQEIKQITHDLRPYLLDRIGLTKSLQSLLRMFSESSTVKIIGAVDEIDGKLHKEYEIHLYRIVQEALNNIQKHSQATEVHAKIELAERKIFLAIIDNGKGFEQTSHKEVNASRGGLGLEGIAERVRILNGEYLISSQPGVGTTINITIPLKE